MIARLLDLFRFAEADPAAASEGSTPSGGSGSGGHRLPIPPAGDDAMTDANLKRLAVEFGFKLVKGLPSNAVAALVCLFTLCAPFGMTFYNSIADMRLALERHRSEQVAWRESVDENLREIRLYLSDQQTASQFNAWLTEFRSQNLALGLKVPTTQGMESFIAKFIQTERERKREATIPK
jgi:hypothetical protein